MPASDGDPGDESSPFRTVVSVHPDDRVSDVIIETVSEISNEQLSKSDRESLDEVESLYESVDPDALDRLFADRNTESRLKFRFADCEVEFIDGINVAVRRTED